MTNDRDLVPAIRAGTSTGVLAVDDPAALAATLDDDPAISVVTPGELGAAVAAARVRLAEVVVDRSRHHRVATGPSGPPPPAADEPEDEARADRQSVRFALVILLLALPAGIAVHLADGLWLAPALPAAALLGLGIVVLVHGRPPAVTSDQRPPQVEVASAGADVTGSPAVHAAEAHLRRARAAWKLHWWERDEPVPDLAAWSGRLPEGVPLTLVAVDPDGEVDDAAVATMTATVPAAVRVVVLRAR